jgi:NRPS condensation-like uncharacterized protein
MSKKEKRPLGIHEKVYWVLDQKTTTQFAVAAELGGDTTDQAWRQALDVVQQRHPNLSVQISGNEYTTAHFEHVDDCPIPLRTVYMETGENWNAELEKEMRIPFDITVAPLARAVLIRQPGKSVFIIVSNHSIGDGMSGALLIRDMLTVLSGEPVDNLSTLTTLDNLAGVTVTEIEKEQTSSFEQAKSSLLLRPEIRVHRLKLSRSRTEKLVQRSKSEQTTVHGALTAAFVLALKQKDTSRQQKPVRILHPLSARPTLDIGDDYGLLVNLVTLTHDPDPQETFWAFARQVRKDIALMKTPEWIKGDTVAIGELFCNEMELKTIEEIVHQAIENEIILTNLGRFPFRTDFGQLQLKSLWGPLVLTPHEASRTVGVATFNGELTLTLTGYSSSDGLLEAAGKIIDQVCEAPEHMQVLELLSNS